MAEEIKSALDAMNAALAGDETDELTGLADEGAADEGGEDTDPTVEGGDGDDVGDATGKTEGADAKDDATSAGSSGDVAAEAAALGVSTKRENGQFKSKDELAADVAAAKAAADGKAPAAKGAKPAGVEDKKGVKKEADVINDPIPQGLKPETETPMRTLIERAKQAEEKVSVAETNFNTIVQGLQATGTTPEQYSEVLSFMQLFNSGDPGQQKQALGLLEDMAERLATSLGVGREVQDPLKAHPDLQAALQRGEVTRQFAIEVARSRNQRGFQNQVQTTAKEQQDAAAAAEREVAQSRATLNQLEAQFRASDPSYERKKEAFLPLLQETFKNVRPNAWPGIFERVYRTSKAPAGAAVPPRVKTPANQPMRAGKSPAATGGKGGGDMKTEPNSALEAMNSALSGMK